MCVYVHMHNKVCKSAPGLKGTWLFIKRASRIVNETAFICKDAASIIMYVCMYVCMYVFMYTCIVKAVPIIFFIFQRNVKPTIVMMQLS